MNEQLDKLNTVVIKRYASTGENQEPELALVITSCEAPTFGLLDTSGNQYHWRQDLTRAATPDESIKYWRGRAEIAERTLEKSIAATNQAIDRNFELIERLNSKNG